MLSVCAYLELLQENWRWKIVATLFAVLKLPTCKSFQALYNKDLKSHSFPKNFNQPKTKQKKTEKKISTNIFLQAQTVLGVCMKEEHRHSYWCVFPIPQPPLATKSKVLNADLGEFSIQNGPGKVEMDLTSKEVKKTHRFVTWFLSLLGVSPVFIFAGTKCPRKTLWCFSFQGVWLCYLYLRGVALNLENWWLLKSTMIIVLAAT